MKDTKSRRLARRRNILKGIAATGAVTAAAPMSWKKPAINSVVIPAHAQTSGITCVQSFQAVVSGPSFDGVVVTPSNTPVLGTFGNAVIDFSLTASLDPSITDWRFEYAGALSNASNQPGFLANGFGVLGTVTNSNSVQISQTANYALGGSFDNTAQINIATDEGSCLDLPSNIEVAFSD